MTSTSIAHSWRPLPAPQVRSMVASPHVKIGTKGGAVSDLFHPAKLRVATLRPRDATLGVVSIPLPASEIRVIGFTFPESAACPHLLIPPAVSNEAENEADPHGSPAAGS